MKIKASNSGDQVPAAMLEVEFALTLSRMIGTVTDDPAQMRIVIYEFARAKLAKEIPWADDQERERLLRALETAIRGVEDFSVRRDEKGRLPPDQNARQVPLTPSAPINHRDYHGAAVDQMSLVPHKIALRREIQPQIVDIAGRSETGWYKPALFFILLCAVLSFAIYEQASLRAIAARGLALASKRSLPAEKVVPAAKPVEQSVAGTAEKVAGGQTQPPSLPLPAVYGVYALNNGNLTELQMLQEQVPDKRIAISTPIGESSRTVLPNGQVKFIIFRRDLANYVLDKVDIRVVAKVTRSIAFDAKGARNISPVENAWNIRNVSREFRVRPIGDSAEMVILQPADADFELSPGRYVLALKSQAYDFLISGNITDPAQCLERTEASNGTFYSECEKL